MDRPDLDPDLHRAALVGLARINRLSLAARSVWSEVAPVVDDGTRITDLACGGGDVTIAVWRRAVTSGVEPVIEGLDRSTVAVDVARERAASCGARARFRVADALRDTLPRCDVVICSLFLHHLAEADAVKLLQRAGDAATRRVVVVDLRRCRFGSLLAAVIPRLFTRSPVVHVDARRSARAAFTPSELRSLARRAGVERPRIRRRWPARMTLAWEPGR